MSKIKLPTPEDLQDLYQQAMGETENEPAQTESEWMNRFLTSLARMLRRRPLSYRAYGIYWWGVKQMLLERKLITSDFIDAEWAEKVQYEQQTYHLLAAYAYYDERFDAGELEDDTHVVELEDGTLDCYILIDEEFEQQAMAHSFVD